MGEAERRREQPQVAVIPATRRAVRAGGQITGAGRLRVAAYCRVSTGDESQQTSYVKQKIYYTELIRKKAEWEMAGIYADEAITGTSRARRQQFNQMMEDAANGRMDYIVTKSISRFARNTLDTLECVRKLRSQDPPVGIYFEKENIDTLDAKGELVLTILSALAQEESRSISDNIRWAFQKNFRAGRPVINLNRMIGYDPGPDGEWVINEEQARVVRMIFSEYLCGCTANGIAGMLNEKGITTVCGKKWRADSVLDVLRNEKYVGDCEMQKTVTTDFLTHHSQPNRGEAPRYYVRDHHAAIIDRMTWEKTKAMLKARERHAKGNRKMEKKKPATRLSHFRNLVCGECGAPLVRKSVTAAAAGYADERCLSWQGLSAEGVRESYSYACTVWRCREQCGSHKRRGRLSGGEREKVETRGRCGSAAVYQTALEQSFMEMLYELKRDYEKRGEESWIVKEFKRAYDAECRKEGQRGWACDRREILEREIAEREAEYGRVHSDWEKCGGDGAECECAGETAEERMECIGREIGELREECDLLEAGGSAAAGLKKNFELFLASILALPEVNAAGERILVNRADFGGADWRMWKRGEDERKKSEDLEGGRRAEEDVAAPDFLEFSRVLYLSFVVKGSVFGDVAVYETNFGVKLRCFGNSRRIEEFLGYRKKREDGKVERLEFVWQVEGRKVKYVRRKK